MLDQSLASSGGLPSFNGSKMFAKRNETISAAHQKKKDDNLNFTAAAGYNRSKTATARAAMGANRSVERKNAAIMGQQN